MGYVASIQSNPAAKMGLILGTYGIGAFVAPLGAFQLPLHVQAQLTDAVLVATHFAQADH